MIVNTPLPSRLSPLAAELGVRPFYGDLHNHSDLSYGHGSFPDALKKAALQLDFVSVTGHAYWPDMPVDDPRVAHIVEFHIKGFEKLKKAWPGHYDVLRDAEEPGHFTVFPGYEIHSNAHGDYTIVLADLDNGPLVIEDTPSELRSALKARYGDRAFAFPHHIGYRLGARGINWKTFDADLSPFVEMFSMHGCAEKCETERGYLHSMGPVDGCSTMEHGLDEGHIFGVVGNTDHHSGFPGSYGHGRMALYSAEHDRDQFWNAMRARRTNALTGDRIHLLCEIGGQIQGSVVPALQTAKIRVEAVAGGSIDYIDIVRNGSIFHRVTPSITPSTISEEHLQEVLIYLEMGWGARGKSHEWFGEVGLVDGEILCVEPRFRGPEIVSPLEGEDSGHRLPHIDVEGGSVRFAVMADANPNNTTPATQGLMIRARIEQNSTITAKLCDQDLQIPVSRLIKGGLSGNLGPIDSPAWRFHKAVLPHQWQWHGSVSLGELVPGDTVYLRLRQENGQMAWTSPYFCR